MERTIPIYHLGALAHYNVAKQPDGTFKAHLLKYSGASRNAPPQRLELHKRGDQWSHNENTYDNLVEELEMGIEIQKEVFEQPLGIENRQIHEGDNTQQQDTEAFTKRYEM